MDQTRWTVEEAARNIAERFVQKCQGMPVRRVERGFAGSNLLLGRLEQQRLASRNGNEYFPTFRALSHIDPELRKYAENCTDIVLKGLKRLYDQSESAASFRFANVQSAVKVLDPTAENEMVRLGMLMSCDFLQLIAGWGGTPGTDDFSVTPRSEILGFEDVQAAWRGELDSLRLQEEHLSNIARARTATRSSTKAPDFSFVHDPKLREIVERDYTELARIRDGVKTRMILAGGLIEGMLLDALMEMEPKALAALKAPKDKTRTAKPLDEWALGSLLDVAVELNVIGPTAQKFGHGVRDYRNFVHPGLEIRSSHNVATEEADVAEKVLAVVIRDLNERKKKQP